MKTKKIHLIIFGTCSILFLIQCNSGTSEVMRSERLVDIGTHNLRVVLSELKSDYTIVLEAGGGKYSDAYKMIQDSLAEVSGVSVISYDRSGFGQSELGPSKFDGLAEVNALKKCLEIIGHDEKYILVGHSYGGLLVQLFTAKYPELVSGLVLIDPMNVNFVDTFGLDNLNAVTPYFESPEEDWQKAANRMVDFFPETIKIIRGVDLPDQIPVVLLTSGIQPIPGNLWRECHEEMVKKSENHKLIIAEGNNHDIPEENPYLVMNTILDLVRKLNE